MNVRSETTKLLGETLAVYFLYRSWQYFTGCVSSGKENKGKNKQLGLHSTRKLLHSKGNHQQNEKTTYQMGDDIYKSCI